ncbi:MAG: hypothetical protein ACK4OK_05890, partial [Thermoflexus sp.]
MRLKVSLRFPRPLWLPWNYPEWLRGLAYTAMARRLADRGFAALVVNQYYRDLPAPIWSSFAEFAANGGWDRAR